MIAPARPNALSSPNPDRAQTPKGATVQTPTGATAPSSQKRDRGRSSLRSRKLVPPWGRLGFPHAFTRFRSPSPPHTPPGTAIPEVAHPSSATHAGATFSVRGTPSSASGSAGGTPFSASVTPHSAPGSADGATPLSSALAVASVPSSAPDGRRATLAEVAVVSGAAVLVSVGANSLVFSLVEAASAAKRAADGLIEAGGNVFNKVAAVVRARSWSELGVASAVVAEGLSKTFREATGSVLMVTAAVLGVGYQTVHKLAEVHERRNSQRVDLDDIVESLWSMCDAIRIGNPRSHVKTVRIDVQLTKTYGRASFRISFDMLKDRHSLVVYDRNGGVLRVMRADRGELFGRNYWSEHIADDVKEDKSLTSGATSFLHHVASTWEETRFTLVSVKGGFVAAPDMSDGDFGIRPTEIESGVLTLTVTLG